MKKEVKVISLGGSLIVPDKINTSLLKEFKRIIKKHSRKYKFIIVCGGGSTARKYIQGAQKLGLTEEFQSYLGISATRMNARLISYIFGNKNQEGIPHSIKEVEKRIKTQNIIFCGGLEYKPKQTSDSTAAEIAKKFKAEFINLTDIQGLYDKNPKKYKNAKFIPKISWKEFLKMANKIKYTPGQHFVLDQTAAKIIYRYKIKTYILGKNLKNLDKLLSNKKFKGTTISY